MLYYRYRPYNELTLKELRYDEIYFSSKHESNDPYEGKVFLSYEFDKAKWERFLKVAWYKSIEDQELLNSLSTMLAEHLANHCPITYEEARNYSYFNVLLKKADPSLAYNLDLCIKKVIKLYRPKSRYTVSFSKKNDDVLLWSHYASKHKGFCLVFKAIDGFLYQDEKRIIKSIHRTPPNGIGQSSSCDVPSKFNFRKINYVSQIEMLDAARFLPGNVWDGLLADEDERLRFMDENESKTLEKHICWSYEDEYRLVLNEPTPWLFGDHFDYSQEERLMHFQPTQLVGIIFGALMDQKLKDRIREIVYNRMIKIYMNCKGCAVFDFVIFEAAISNTSREVKVTPIEIRGPNFSIFQTDVKFELSYKYWEDGWAIPFDETGRGASRKQFI